MKKTTPVVPVKARKPDRKEQGEPYILPDGRMDGKQTAMYLGIHRSVLGKMRTEGTGPPYMRLVSARGKLFYYKADVDAWLASQTKHVSTLEEEDTRRSVPSEKRIPRRLRNKEDSTNAHELDHEN